MSSAEPLLTDDAWEQEFWNTDPSQPMKSPQRSMFIAPPTGGNAIRQTPGSARSVASNISSSSSSSKSVGAPNAGGGGSSIRPPHFVSPLQTPVRASASAPAVDAGVKSPLATSKSPAARASVSSSAASSIPKPAAAVAGSKPAAGRTAKPPVPLAVKGKPPVAAGAGGGYANRANAAPPNAGGGYASRAAPAAARGGKR